MTDINPENSRSSDLSPSGSVFTKISSASVAPNHSVNGLGLSSTRRKVDRYTGWTNWFKSNVEAMTPLQIGAYIRTVEAALHPGHFLPISDANPEPSMNDQVELIASLAFLREKLEEMQPTVPGRSGGVVHENARDVWPEWLPKHTLQIHLHLAEIVDAWRINPSRNHASHVGISETSQTNGITAVDFDSQEDLNAFVNHYGLLEFIVHCTTYQSVNNKDSHLLVLHNTFQKEAAMTFLQVLHDAINQLVAINHNRRNALMMENGRVGYMSVDHFSSLERKQIERIQYHRRILVTQRPEIRVT